MAYESWEKREGGFEDFVQPEMVDQLVRQAVAFGWTLIPKERRSPAELRSTIYRFVDRALENFQQDRELFPKNNS